LCGSTMQLSAQALPALLMLRLLQLQHHTREAC
jgi:hypothetical protein